MASKKYVDMMEKVQAKLEEASRMIENADLDEDEVEDASGTHDAIEEVIEGIGMELGTN